MTRKSSNLGQSLESLSPLERAKRYRQFAEEAMRKANSAADPDRGAEYFTMASSWHAMAVEAERIAEGAQSELRQDHRRKPAEPKDTH